MPGTGTGAGCSGKAATAPGSLVPRRPDPVVQRGAGAPPMKVVNRDQSGGRLLLRSRLCWRIACVVFVSILAVEAIILVPSYRYHLEDQRERLEETALASLRTGLAMIDPADPAQLATVADRALSQSAIQGLTIFAQSGVALHAAGDAPAHVDELLSAVLGRDTDAGRKRPPRSQVPGTSNRDTLWTSERIGMPIHILARIGQGSVEAESATFLRYMIALAVLLAVTVSGVTMLLLGRLVLQPVLTLREHMIAAQGDPEDPAHHTLEVHGKDEVSDAVRAFNAMLLRISDSLRQRAEAQELRFKDFADSGSDYFWELDADLRFSYFSERFTEITGVPPNELLGRTREEAVVPDVDLAAWERHLSDLADHRPVRSFVLPRTKSDGRKVWLSVSAKPVFAKDGTFQGYRGTGCDITDMVEAETALVAAKEQAETAKGNLIEALEAMSEGFALYDDEDRLVICNRKYRELWDGHAEAIVPGATYKSILEAGLACGTFPEAIGREPQWLAERLIAHAQPVKLVDERLEGARWLRTNERRTRAGGTVSTKMDLSELKERENELRAAKREAERASQAKSEFLANMSHELRTPLNAIIGFSEIIMSGTMGPAGTAKHVEYAEDINKSGLHLLNLINEILDLSKIEAGKLELNEGPVDVKATFEVCLAIVADPIAEAGLSLKTDLAPTLPHLWADELKLKQIVINLLSNALKFSDPPGEVRLKAHIEANGSFVFTVGDDGIGMTPEEIPVALSPFGQVSSSLDRTHNGTGLGLPLTKALVELHGGRLEIESFAGVGTTVTVRLPSARIRTMDTLPQQKRAGG